MKAETTLNIFLFDTHVRDFQEDRLNTQRVSLKEKIKPFEYRNDKPDRICFAIFKGYVKSKDFAPNSAP